MGRLQSLKAQIRHDVFRLFGTYILVVTSIILLLAIYGIFFYQQEQFKHYKALIVTRLNSEISDSFRQASDLARSTEVWTGLTDSEGGGAYLLPLLAKANQNNFCKFDLLDYQGRFFINSGYAAGLKLDTPANIQRTIEDSGTHLELVPINQTELLVATVPIVANFVDSTIGLVLMHIDLGQIMTTLNFPDDLAIQYSLDPFEETSSDFSGQSESFRFEWSAAGKNHAIYIQLQQDYLSALVFVLTGLVVSLTSGGLLLLGLGRWTRIFSDRTTQRLDDLVQLATDTVEGRGDGSLLDHTGDEIGKVSNALQSMLGKQQLASQKQAIFSRVFETAAEAILITNEQGLVMDVNAALTDMTGYAKEELINQHAGLLYIHNDKGIGFPLIAEAVRQHGTWRGETYFLSKQQALLPVFCRSRLCWMPMATVRDMFRFFLTSERFGKQKQNSRIFSSKTCSPGCPTTGHFWSTSSKKRRVITSPSCSLIWTISKKSTTPMDTIKAMKSSG